MNKKEKNIIEINHERNQIQEKVQETGRKYSAVSVLRLFVFLGFVFLCYGIIKMPQKTLYLVGAVFMAAFFLGLVRYHAVLDHENKLLLTKSDVLSRYLARYDSGWKEIEDDGHEFLTDRDMVARDIDLLGAASIYQYLNISHSPKGRRRFARSLVSNMERPADTERQQAIQELAKKHDFAVRFETISSMIYDKKKKKELPVPEESKRRLPGIFFVLMLLIPVLNLVTALLTVLSLVPVWALGVTFLFGLASNRMTKAILDGIVYDVYMYGMEASDYKVMLECIQNEEFSSAYLKQMHEEISSNQGMLTAVRKLGTIGAAYNIAYNPLVHILLSGFLGWDFIVAFAADRWNQKYEEVFFKSFDVIATTEELLSFSVLSYLRDTCIPVVNPVEQKKPVLMAKGMLHPLLAEKSVVDNDCELSNGLTIITGSNMSGKTTFLRTLALNMVLAYAGAGVPAERFEVPFFRIFTSMRVMDDAASGISTFYAEILRIKQMAEYIQSEPGIPAICFIDEIFKGTNSADRIVGAREALQRLTKEARNMVLVSTHDFELCDIQKLNGESADNYHFEEHYVDEELRFDYKIRSGRCTTRNALKLLKLAGLAEES